MKNNKLKIVVGVAALAMALVAGMAADVVGTLPQASVAVVNTQNGTTNIVLNQQWPNSMAASTDFTNVTVLNQAPLIGGSFTVQIDEAALQASASNVVWTIGRNVAGGSPTNAVTGAPAQIEWFATWPTTLNNVAGSQNCVTTNFTTYNNGGGAYTTYYLGWVVVPAATTLTNVQVYVNSR